MKKTVGIFTFVILSLIISLYFFVDTNLKPVSSDKTDKQFVINQGDGIDTISQRLQKAGLIRNSYIFMAVAFQTDANSKLKAGLFRLSPSLDTRAIVEKLSQGGSQDYWLKIIDGSRIEEVALIFSKTSTITNDDFLTSTTDLEGYIFPDSYLIPQYYDLEKILAIIKKNFDKKLALAKAGATNIQMSDAQIITFASLLEREARTLNSKQQVAGILQNRLEIGMALQVDASVQYARDSKFIKQANYDYWKPINPSDLDISSVFNTYKNPGLPPAPICNPGYDSIFAALHPFKSDYLYYITGTDNQMHYAKTLEEHNANIAKYLK